MGPLSSPVVTSYSIYRPISHRFRSAPHVIDRQTELVQQNAALKCIGLQKPNEAVSNEYCMMSAIRRDTVNSMMSRGVTG